jgi:hypothetical protein
MAQSDAEVKSGCGEGATTYPIDMRTAQEPKARFSREQRVCVLVYNMNPFTTLYRIRATSTAYPQDVLGELPKALGITIPKPAAATADANPTGDVNTLGFMPPTRPTAESRTLSPACSRLDLLERQLSLVQGQRQKLESELVSVNTILSALSAAADSLYQPDLTAEDLVARSRAFLATFPIPLVEPLVVGFVPQVNGLQAAAAAVIQRAIQSQRDGTCTHLEDEVSDLSVTLSSELPGIVRLATATDDGIAEFSALRTLALQVVRAPRVLQHAFWVGDFDNPTYVDVVVRTAPRPLTDTKDTLWRTERSPRLHFGDRRQFSVLGGLSFGVDKVPQSFQEVRTAEDPASRRIQVSEETVPLAPMLYASAALLRRWGASVNAVGGVGPSFTESIKAVLFFGLGFGVEDDRVFLLFGGLSAPRTRLAGGYDEGDILPDSQESIPVITDRKLKFALGVAIRPF